MHIGNAAQRSPRENAAQIRLAGTLTSPVFGKGILTADGRSIYSHAERLDGRETAATAHW